MPPRQPRLQQLVQACPFGGVNLELPPWRIEDKDFQNIANFFCTEKDLRTRPEPFFTAVSANAINGQIDGYDIDGIRHFLLATKTKAYGYIGTNWQELTGTLTATDLNLYTGTSLQGMILFANGVDKIKLWDGVSGAFTDENVNAPIAKFVTTFGNRVIAGFTVEGGNPFPQRIRWTVDSFPQDWVNVGSGFQDIIEGTDPLTGLVVLTNRLVMFFPERIVFADRTFDALNPFTFINYSKEGVGNICPYSLAQWGNICCFVGRDDVYMFDAQTHQRIGNKARKAILNDIYQGNFDLVMGGITDSTAGRDFLTYWLILPNGAIWTYDFGTQAWTRQYFTGRKATSVGRFKTIHGVRIIDLVGTIAQQNWIINLAGSQISADNLTLGFSNGQIGELDYSEVINDTWVLGPSKEFDYGQSAWNKTLKRIQFVYRDLGVGQAELTLSNEFGNTVVLTVSFGVLGTGTIKNKIIDFTLSGTRLSWTLTGNFPIAIQEVIHSYFIRGPLLARQA